MTRTTLLPSIACLMISLVAYPPQAANAQSNVVARLGPGVWYEIPSSQLEQVAYPWPANVITTKNGVGFKAVIGNWSGGAYDTRRDRLLIWGGGHFAYAGNEIYGFDLGHLRWQRLSEPSLEIDLDYRAGDDIYIDGKPRSNHTYGSLQYVPVVDRFCSFGTSANFPASRGGPTTWAYDFSAGKWERKSPAPGFGFGTSSAWDPVTQRIWIRLNGKEGMLAEWDPVKDHWTARARGLEHKTWFDQSAAIDPLGRRYVAVGGGKIRTYDLSSPGSIIQRDIRTSGPQDIVAATNPGFEYDPIIDKFVGWNGGADIFTLDPETWQWQRLPPAASNRTRPTPAAKNGTFGRFRYVPSRNVYVVVNSVRENVYIYRLSDLQRAAIPPRLAAATRSTDAMLAGWASRQSSMFKHGPSN
ncbi:MAG: hypothetical protein IPP18_17290 [Rhodocyclaceae bacterium]|nr:hypothetical protein [Rhodocyclaceae bacterium]MBK6675725.1 hypothetical protein [Rhodocyclaceae bacterium]MBK9311879.1 hypothetical protein [Rhodocyclaceae bacterium]MBK9956769.1 hypothetical protein [Rhodocyclaceae bacterium]